MNVKQQHTGEISEAISDDDENDRDLYDVEILFKTQNMRKRLDLTIRIIHSDEDEEMYVYNHCIKVGYYKKLLGLTF